MPPGKEVPLPLEKKKQQAAAQASEAAPTAMRPKRYWKFRRDSRQEQQQKIQAEVFQKELIHIKLVIHKTPPVSHWAFALSSKIHYRIQGCIFCHNQKANLPFSSTGFDQHFGIVNQPA